MDENATTLSFADWLTAIFKEMSRGNSNEMFPNFGEGYVSPVDTLTYITAAFENAGSILSPFSNAELDRGLYYLVSHASEDTLLLVDNDIPWEVRKRCIASFRSLFEQVFAVRCPPHLMHIDDLPGENHLNRVCYMWWDVLPVIGRANEPHGEEINHCFIDIMEATLKIDSLACRESALHGLGHWQYRYPARVATIIDRFLAENSALSPELIDYAHAAKIGRVR